MNEAFQQNAFQNDSFQQFALATAFHFTTRFIANVGTMMNRGGG